MKKTVSAILVCVIMVCSLFALVSCGKSLVGTYKAEKLLSDVTYEFELGGKVTKTSDRVIGKAEVLEGTYEFSDDNTRITFTFGEDTYTHDFVDGEEGGVKYIKIDGVKYNEVK